jgi:acyl-homoserine lactone acylase PvdQ
MRDVIRHLALAASIATALVPCAARSAPDTTALSDVPTTTYHVNGLNAPAEILIGVFGVPHLYADSLYEVFFAPGQSGDPTSTHHRDLFAYWADERYVPLAYTRERVESPTNASCSSLPANPTEPARGHERERRTTRMPGSATA